MLKWFSTTDKNKKIIWLINVVFLQTMLALFTAFWNYLTLYNIIPVSMQVITVIALSIAIFLTITAVSLINEIVRLSQKERELEINKAMMEKDKELISILSTHRHDFQNHLQVIMGLIQLGRNDSAVGYIKEVTKSLRQTSSTTVQIKNLEVAAMFLMKKNEAEERNIQFQLEMKSELVGLSVPATDISRILGNLIENAFDAVSVIPEKEDRVVRVCLNEGAQQFIISVWNKRPLIPKDIQDKIFEKGFSTKGMAGSGLGLAIVKELTEKHGGSVQLVSDTETGTEFTLTFPKMTADVSA